MRQYLSALILLLLVAMLFGVPSVCYSAFESDTHGSVRTEWVFEHHSVMGRLLVAAERNGFLAEFGAFSRGYLHRPEDLVDQIDTYSLRRAIGPSWARFGSFRPEWTIGPMKSIMVTREAPGSLTLEYGVTHGTLNYTKFASLLDSNTTFYAHRLELSVSPSVTIGLKETALIREVPGIGVALVPFYPLYLTKYIPGIPATAQDNINIGLDACVDIGSLVTLYGEIHIAEWPLTPSATNPRVYGLQVGFDASNLLPKVGVSCSYVRLGNYLYSGSTAEVDYQYRGICLGHHLGQDADELSLEVAYRIAPQASFSVSASHVRKGEGEIHEYSGDFPPAERERNSFLRGIVEQRFLIGLSAKLDYMKDFSIEGGIRFANLNNAAHVPGRTEQRLEGSLALCYSF